jgi:hypothetical protein
MKDTAREPSERRGNHQRTNPTALAALPRPDPAYQEQPANHEIEERVCRLGVARAPELGEHTYGEAGGEDREPERGRSTGARSGPPTT